MSKCSSYNVVKTHREPTRPFWVITLHKDPQTLLSTTSEHSHAWDQKKISRKEKNSRSGGVGRAKGNVNIRRKRGLLGACPLLGGFSVLPHQISPNTGHRHCHLHIWVGNIRHVQLKQCFPTLFSHEIFLIGFKKFQCRAGAMEQQV